MARTSNMAIYHPKKGMIRPAGKRYDPIRNASVPVFVDARGNRHELDGTERDVADFRKERETRRKEIEDNHREKASREMQDEADFQKNLDEQDQEESEREEAMIRHRELIDRMDRIISLLEKG